VGGADPGGGLGQKNERMSVFWIRAWVAAALAWSQMCIALHTAHDAMLQRGHANMDSTVALIMDSGFGVGVLSSTVENLLYCDAHLGHVVWFGCVMKGSCCIPSSWL